MMNSEINLLWTSGWESTFRLLFALLIEKRKINLFYIDDHRRKSRTIEIKRMNKILKLIRKKYPQVSHHINQLKIYQKKEIKIPDEINDWYTHLSDNYHIGSQYLWLASFQRMMAITELELSIEKFIEIKNSIVGPLMSNVTGTGHDCRLKNNLSNPYLQLFNGFRFPIIHLSKKELETIAIKYGFMDIMHLTWFCHTPKLKIIPCGSCKPCEVAIENGFLDKLPLLSQYFYFKDTFKSTNILKFVKFKKSVTNDSRPHRNKTTSRESNFTETRFG